MKKISLFFAMVIPMGIIAQCNKSFFFEGGTSFNVVQTKSFYIQDPGGWTTSYKYAGTITSIPSYYVKGGIEKTIDLCPKSAISFPMSLGYFNETQKIVADGGYSGCFGGEWGRHNITRNNHYVAFSLGIKFIGKPTEKITIQNGINLSPNTLVYSENTIKITNENGTTGYSYGQGPMRSGIALSAQSGLFYQLCPKTKIGINAEYFFINKQVIPKRNLSNFGMYDFESGYGGYSAMLNLGVRLQRSF